MQSVPTFHYRIVLLVFIGIIFLSPAVSFAQQKDTTVHTVMPEKKDSLIILKDSTKQTIIKVDTTATTKKDKHRPRTAAIRSAIVPGLGQIYNKKYWKLPLVYGALGITGYFFVDNLKTYRELKNAYAIRYQLTQPPKVPLRKDSSAYFNLKTVYQIRSLNTIRNARDEFRRNIDYSVLVFILFWGLNVVDATVDAHLRGFDVSPDLTLKFKAGHSQMGGTNGISLVLAPKDHHQARVLPYRF